MCSSCHRILTLMLEVSRDVVLYALLTEIALVEPLAVAWHAVDAAQIKKGDDALVLGAGPIGLGVIQCLKAQGADKIIVAEVSTERQNFAKHFGATHIFDPRHDDVVAKCKELTDGRGVQTSLDCAGLAVTLKTACLAVRSRGRVINVAIWLVERLYWREE